MHSSKRPHLLHKRGREVITPAKPASKNVFDDLHHLDSQVNRADVHMSTLFSTVSTWKKQRGGDRLRLRDSSTYITS